MARATRVDEPIDVRGKSGAEWGLLAAAGAVALVAWLRLELDHGDFTTTDLYVLTFVTLGALAPLLRCLRRPEGVYAAITRTLGRAGTGSIPRLRDLGTPRASAALLSWAIAPAMLAMTPFAFRYYPGDASVIGGWVAYALVIGPVCVLLGWFIWVFVLFPVCLALSLVVRRATRRAGPGDRYAAALAAFLFSMPLVAVLVGFSTPGPSGRSGRGSQFLALAGVDAGQTRHPAVLWAARAAVLLFTGAAFALTRDARRRGNGRGGAAPPAP